MKTQVPRQCAFIATVALLFGSGAVAQQQMPPTLRQRADAEGHVHVAPIIDWLCCADLTELVKHSTLVVRGKVTNSQSRLSDDERSVFTDYTIDIQDIYKQIGIGSLVPGSKIQVTKLGGHLLVDGHPVEYDASPPIPEGVVEMFFITTCTEAHCATPYFFAGPNAAVGLDKGHVSCAAKPGIWKSSCGMNTASFVSVIKHKVIDTSHPPTQP